MKRLMAMLLVISLVLSQLVITFGVSAESTCVKNEFRIITDGNEKDISSSVPEYNESELSAGDLEGETKTSAAGNKTVRVLKAGQANTFKIEIDKNATAIQINDFKLDSADGELYQYHFYLGNDLQNLNIIGSYDGSFGRSVREHGDNFSWSTVDQGWIRAQNNTDVVGRAALNDDGTKKVVYLKVSSKGGDCQNPQDIDANAEVSYVSFTVQSIVPISVVEQERKAGGILDEFRIITSGNEKDSSSSVTEYTENELSVGDLEGETKTSVAGNKTVRVLKAGQANIFKIEINKNATAIQINDFKIDSADGELYQYHFYLGNDLENLNIIGSYDGSLGRSVREHGDNFSWSTVDQGWIRAQNNTDVVGRAALNDDATKKVVYLKISSKGGDCQNPQDIDANAQVSYVGFTVQAISNAEPTEPENPEQPENPEAPENPEENLKTEFTVLANGNTKDENSETPQYFEDELMVSDLEGEIKDTTDGQNKVRILKAGQANVFKIEIDKNATELRIDNFKLNSADGELYQYHFYLGNDLENLNIIGSYDGSEGRIVREDGETFSWSTVDKGWIRAQNNTDVVGRATLNDDSTKKVVYLKLSSKGGDCQNPEDIDLGAQLSYVSFDVITLIDPNASEDPENPEEPEIPEEPEVPENPEAPENPEENLKTEFTVLANGNTKDENSEIPQYFEDELKASDLEGEIKDTADGTGKVRILKAGQANVFKIEIDKNATELRIDNFKLNSADGELYQYHFYLGNDLENLNIIGSYDGSEGRIVREDGETFSWSTVDKGWIRAQNNTDVVRRAALNDDGTKKVVYLKLSAKGGDSQNSEDIDENAQIAYVSFDVITVIDTNASEVPENPVEPENPKNPEAPENPEENLKTEFTVLANGNTKDENSEIPQYFEDELKASDLEGEIKDTANGKNKVRILKAGQANVFKIEIDKNATEIRLDNFNINIADGHLYQYHFYISNDNSMFNIIGSYDGDKGRVVREDGETFSWSTVDKGWIRAQNNADVVGRAALNEDGTKKVVYLKLSAKGGDSQKSEDIDANAHIAYVSFDVLTVIGESNEESNENITKPVDTTANVKTEFTVLANGNIKDSQGDVPQYYEDELKSGELQGKLKTSADKKSKVRVLKSGEENVFRIEIDKQAVAVRLNNFNVNGQDGYLYQYHFYISDDNSKFNIIGSYDGANGRSVKETGEIFSWITVDQGWIRAQNNKEILARAPLNETGDKKVVYLKLSSKGGDCENSEDIDKNGQIAYVSFDVETVIDPNYTYTPPTQESNGVQVDENSYINDEFEIIANGNTKSENSEIPQYFEDELKVGELEGELKTSADGKSKVRVLKSGQANVFRIEISKYATAVMLSNFKITSQDGELYQYHFYISDDGEKFNIFGSYDGSGGRAVREDGDTFSWTNVDQGWIRAQNNLEIVERAPFNDAGDKKVLYLKLSSKGGDCENPADIDPEAQIAYISFTVQSIVDTSQMTGTETSKIRYDMSPLRIEGMTDEEWNKQQEFYSVYQYLNNHVSDADRRVESGNIWSQIQVIEEEEMVLVAGKEGYITYNVDLNDKTRNFTVEIFGVLQNVNILASKDDGESWYLIGSIGENGMLREYILPNISENAELCQKNIEWILLANPEKKFQIRLQAFGDNSVFKMVNMVINQEYVVDPTYAQELPTEIPEDYQVPEAFKLVLSAIQNFEESVENAPVNPFAIAAVAFSGVLAVGCMPFGIYLRKKRAFKI